MGGLRFEKKKETRLKVVKMGGIRVGGRSRFNHEGGINYGSRLWGAIKKKKGD